MLLRAVLTRITPTNCDWMLFWSKPQEPKYPCRNGVSIGTVARKGAAYGGSHDAYIDGITGVTPTDETPESLTRVLRELLRDPSQQGKDGDRGPLSGLGRPLARALRGYGGLEALVMRRLSGYGRRSCGWAA